MNIDPMNVFIDFEQRKEQHRKLLEKYDWFHTMPWWRCLLLKVCRSKKGAFYNSDEDSHCFIECGCGANFSACDGWITWCSNCGAGYSTEFKCYQYTKLLKPIKKRTK